MRRRRHVLQVSTFPFLAVLLCAMGSLVLLLFIMDRRAKIVARNRVAESKKVVEPAKIPATKVNSNEDEERKKEEHAHWLLKVEQLLENLGDLKKRIASRRDELNALKASKEQRYEKLQDAMSSLDEIQSKTKTVHTRNIELSKQYAEELQDLTKLQKIVAKLATKKRKQDEIYSVVPYFGKRGDDRKPIYIEVVDDFLIVHPDQWKVTVMPATFTQLRNSLYHAITARTNSKKPYLLFLVRPNGITAYHRTAQIVRSLKIDYGYELIDGDWRLDLKPETIAALGDPKKLGDGRLARGNPDGGGKFRPDGDGKSRPGGEKFAPPNIGGNPKSSGGGGPFAQIAPRNSSRGQGPKKTGPKPKNGEDDPAPGNQKPNGENKQGPNGGGTNEGKRKSLIERYIGNRDFVITVVCEENAVVVYPGGRRYGAESFLQTTAEKHPVCAEIRSLIQRRQATLRADEPPYRPRIVFRVQPEGRRSYFFAYPVLGTLGLPMVQTRVK